METEKVNSNNTQEIQNDDSTKNETGRDQDTNLGEYLPKLLDQNPDRKCREQATAIVPLRLRTRTLVVRKKIAAFLFFFSDLFLSSPWQPLLLF